MMIVLCIIHRQNLFIFYCSKSYSLFNKCQSYYLISVRIKEKDYFMQDCVIAVYGGESMQKTPLMISYSLLFSLSVLIMDPKYRSKNINKSSDRSKEESWQTTFNLAEENRRRSKPMINAKLRNKCGYQVDYFVHSGEFHFQGLFSILNFLDQIDESSAR